MNYQSHSNERIGHGFFDMVKAVFCAKDRYYIWFTFGGCTVCTVGGGWTHRVRRHLLHERCQIYRGGGGGVLINGERPCWTSIQGAILQLWSKMSSFSFDEKYAWISKYTALIILFIVYLHGSFVSFVDILFPMCSWCVNSLVTTLYCAVLPRYYHIGGIFIGIGHVQLLHTAELGPWLGAPPSARVSYL